MAKHDKASAGRRPPPGTSPVGAGRGDSAGSTRVVTFTALSEAQWQAIRSTRKNWPEGTDWRREIERIGRDHWEVQATRETWVKKLQGKKAAKQRAKIYKAWISTQQLQKALAALVDDGLLDDDFPRPDLERPEKRLEMLLDDYDLWVRPFAGQNNPIQAYSESHLMSLWRTSGGKLGYSRKKDDPGTPYGPMVDFLTHTLNAILGNAPGPFGIAKMIDRHRGGKSKEDPFLMYAMSGGGETQRWRKGVM